MRLFLLARLVHSLVHALSLALWRINSKTDSLRAAVMVGIFIAIDADTPPMMPIMAAAKAGLALPAASTERDIGLRDV